MRRSRDIPPRHSLVCDGDAEQRWILRYGLSVRLALCFLGPFFVFACAATREANCPQRALPQRKTEPNRPLAVKGKN